MTRTLLVVSALCLAACGGEDVVTPPPVKQPRSVSVELENRATSERDCSVGYTLPGADPVRVFEGPIAAGEVRRFASVLGRTGDFTVTLSAECYDVGAQALRRLEAERTVTGFDSCRFIYVDGAALRMTCNPGT